MDAALLWIVIAAQARTGLAAGRAFVARPNSCPTWARGDARGRGNTASSRRWGWLKTAGCSCAALFARQDPGRVRARSAWVRALLEVSLIR